MLDEIKKPPEPGWFYTFYFDFFMSSNIAPFS